jgi:hypothetical protein
MLAKRLIAILSLPAMMPVVLGNDLLGGRRLLHE